MATIKTTEPTVRGVLAHGERLVAAAEALHAEPLRLAVTADLTAKAAQTSKAAGNG